MAKMEIARDTKMYDLELGEDSRAEEPSDSASSSLLNDADRSSLEMDILDEDGGIKRRKNMQPKHLICLTIGTGGYDNTIRSIQHSIPNADMCHFSLQVIWTAILAQGSVSDLLISCFVMRIDWVA